MNEISSIIRELVQSTAESLGKSFANYWPANDVNDAAERNVSLHFAHAMLSSGFSVFAEADHPNRQKIRGIDILGLSQNNDWFLGCEFKRLYSSRDVSSLIEDIARLESFQLRNNFSSEIYDENLSNIARKCRKGFGLVGGLHWVTGRKQSSTILNTWVSSQPNNSNLIAQFTDKNAFLPDPLLVIEFPRGSYYLLVATFPIGTLK